MVFNTGAALLDAIVLAVVSKEEEGTVTRSPRMCGACWRYLSPHYIRFFADFRRMNVWRHMIWHMRAGIADTIRSQRREQHS